MKEVIDLICSEMKPSLGCTEPVAIGLAASRTCQILGGKPEKLFVTLSPNIFKNAFCVKIPNVGFPGVALAATLGVLLSKPNDDMEIFSGVTPELVEQAQQMLKEGFTVLNVKEEEKRFYIGIKAQNAQSTVETITIDSHDNMVVAIKDGKELYNKSEQVQSTEKQEVSFDITALTFAEIINICEKIDLSEIEFLEKAIEMNRAVSSMGKSGNYGLNVGKTIQKLEEEGVIKEDIISFVKKIVASACDCRMGGGNIATMTVLGSGNQGIEAILPVASVAQYLDLPREKMLRGVMISIMMTIYIKYHVGRLSPVCGATLSGAAASCAITWLLGGNLSQMEGAIQNMVGNLVGMVCDGAKDGCALKLCNCAGEAVLSAQLALHQCIIKETDGIISKRVEDTVKNITHLSTIGMAAADKAMIFSMMGKTK